MRQLEKMEIIYHSFPETRKQLYAEYKQKSLQMPNTRRVKQNLHVTGEHSSMSSNKAFNLAKLTLTYKVYSTWVRDATVYTIYVSQYPGTPRIY